MTSESGRTRLMVGASLSAGAGAALAGVALLVTAGYVVARAADRPPILDLALLFVGVRFFGLARPALRYAERLASHDATLRLLRKIRRRFCEACLPLAPARLADWRAGDLLARLAADVDTLQEKFLRWQAPLFVATIVTLVVGGVLAAFDWRAAAIVVVAAAINGGALQTAGVARAEAQAALTADLVMLARGRDTVAAFGREGAEAQRLAARQAALDRLDERSASSEAWRNGVAAAVSGLATAAIVAVVAARVQAGALNGAWAVALTLGAMGAFEALDALPLAWRARARVAAAAHRVDEVTAASPAVTDPPNPGPWPASTQAPALRLDSVSFGYNERLVLDAVSLDVAPGEHVAIVGASGAGKSTLLDLVCRFHDPASGAITIDGRDLRHVALAQLRSRLAVVPQQVHVFDDTLRENVRLARPAASDEDVRQALDAVGLTDVAGARTDDLDARLGEDGRRLSAGERQRLGVARIFLTDARLVLVDEPAANLDVETERAVLAALRARARDCTLLVVSHRLAAVRDFDRIAILDGGRLVAGTHAALLAEHDAYRELWNAEQRVLLYFDASPLEFPACDARSPAGSPTLPSPIPSSAGSRRS